MKALIIFVMINNFALTKNEETTHYLHEDMISFINKKDSTWTAGVNFPKNPTMTELQSLVQNTTMYDDSKNSALITRDKNYFELVFSVSFDAREKWPGCVNQPPKQGSCDTSWVLVPLSVISDRLCIGTNLKKKFTFSEQDVLTCCRKCQQGKSICSGGWTSRVWDYWIENGIVSGGPEGCKPLSNSTTCQDYCTNKKYPLSYSGDKYYAAKKYKIPKDSAQIQIELAIYGPVVAQLRVYSDFFVYKEGIYQHLGGSFVGYHVVKIVGWGVEVGRFYWLCANTWGMEWGDSGYFKILLGVDHCGIESNVLTGRDHANFLRHERILDTDVTQIMPSNGWKLEPNLIFLMYCAINISIFVTL
ncbi:hypothetical protein Zmor_024220 [Zophobas morio]|uniref:Peptidase C1A papain C-terminal domain-containing protein n=1 Tax=Zophobas morio TaxID=2755281 RepID=A0AA38M7X0_9CUCU|nr:hypothetical protein Zmor_024220 [Zophobas morio]